MCGHGDENESIFFSQFFIRPNWFSMPSSYTGMTYTLPLEIEPSGFVISLVRNEHYFRFVAGRKTRDVFNSIIYQLT